MKRLVFFALSETEIVILRARALLAAALRFARPEAWLAGKEEGRDV